jgi:hypothetical protein
VKKLVILLVSACLGLSTAPAMASPLTLPGNDLMFQVSCDGSHNRNQLSQVNLATSRLSVIGVGDGSPGQACASQGAFAAEGWYYFVDYYQDDRLRRTNLETGEIDVIGTLHDESGNRNIQSIAVGPTGDVYAIGSHNLYHLNIADASLTLATAIDDTGLTLGGMYGFAYDPTTQKFWVADDSGAGLYKLNVDTGHLTFVASNPDYWVGSMDFDSDGNLWFNGDGDYVARVAPSQFGDSSKIRQSDPLIYETDNIYSESLLIVRDPIPEKKPEGLAYTGAADVTWILWLAAFAVIGAVVLRRRES